MKTLQMFSLLFLLAGLNGSADEPDTPFSIGLRKLVAEREALSKKGIPENDPSIMPLYIKIKLWQEAGTHWFHPPAEPIAWGNAVDGLKLGLSCAVTTTTSRTLPPIDFYFANENDHDIEPVYQASNCCVLEINGKYFGQGGQMDNMSSYMPPGRKYGPIAIETDQLRLISDLKKWNESVPKGAPRPALREGDNAISLYYVVGKQMVQSGVIRMTAK